MTDLADDDQPRDARRTLHSRGRRSFGQKAGRMNEERTKPGRSNLFVVAGPFCKFGPAVSDEVLGIFGPHFDSAVEADSEVLA